MKTELQKLYELLISNDYEVTTNEDTHDSVIKLEDQLIDAIGRDRYCKEYEDNIMQIVSNTTRDGWMSGFLYAMSLIGSKYPNT